jgi:multiple antibiotic resistance protein
MVIAQLALTFFLILDPLGNVPAFIAILRNFDDKAQRRIILREMFIALGVILLFNFLGKEILSLIGISQSTVLISGGIILFLIALQMIFPTDSPESIIKDPKDPFIVPLAIPLIAGPSMIGAVIVYSNEVDNSFITTLSILIAWIASLLILLSSSFLQRVLGNRFLVAGERLMGFIMTILAVDLFNRGIILLLK